MSDFLQDTLAGFLRPVNEQVEIACENLANDPKLAGGYNAIGFSQGAQFLWVELFRWVSARKT